MTTVYNTLPFKPKFRLGDSPLRGQVVIKDNIVVVGQDIINLIESNPTKLFLVSKSVYDFCNNDYMYNVIQW